MRQITGIVKLYYLQFTGQMRDVKWRLQLGVAVVVCLLAGLHIASGIRDLVFIDGDQFAPAGLNEAFTSGAMFLTLTVMTLTPYILFARNQLSEMVTLTQLPIRNVNLALKKILDLTMVLAQLSLLLILPSVLLTLRNGARGGCLIKTVAIIIILSLGYALVVLAAYAWSASICWFSRFLPARGVRLSFVVVVWCLVNVGTLLAVRETLGLNSPDALEGPSRADEFWASVVHGGASLDFSLIGLGLIALMLMFRLTRALLARVYVERIVWIRDNLSNPAVTVGRSGRHWAPPLFPRPILAMWRKDLLITLTNFEFWIFFGALFAIFLVIGQMETESTIEFFISGELSVVLIVMIFFVLQVGLWMFKYERKDCVNLLFYPVRSSRIVIGKSMALLTVVLPLVAALLAVNHEWLSEGNPLLKILFVATYVHACCVASVVCGGAAVHYEANNVIQSVTWMARFLFFTFMGVSQVIFWLFNVFAETWTPVYMIGITLNVYVGQLLADKAAWIIPELAARGENGLLEVETKANRRAKSSTRSNRSPRWMAALLTAPVFTIGLYLFSGLRGYVYLPNSWRFGLIVWVVALGFIAFWPAVRRSIRAVAFIALLLVVPLRAIIEFNRSPFFLGGSPLQFIEWAMSHPERLHAVTDNSDYFGAVLGRGTTDSKRRPDEITLPMNISDKFDLPINATLEELWEGPPPPPDRLLAFTEAIARDKILSQYEFHERWARWLSRSIDAERAIALLDERLKEPTYRRQTLHYLRVGILNAALGRLSPATKRLLYRHLRSLSSPPPVETTLAIINELKLGSMAPEWQREAFSDLMDEFNLDGKTLKKSEKGMPGLLWSFHSAVIDPDKNEERSIGYLDGQWNAYLNFMSELTIPEAFDALQKHVFAALPESSLTLFPKQSELVFGAEEPSPERLAEWARTRPVYYAFLWRYHPVLRKRRFDVVADANGETTAPSLRVIARILAARGNGEEIVQFTAERGGWSFLRSLALEEDNAQWDVAELMAQTILHHPESLKRLITDEKLIENHVADSVLGTLRHRLRQTSQPENPPKNDATLHSDLEAYRQTLLQAIKEFPNVVGKIGRSLDEFLNIFNHKVRSELRSLMSASGLPPDCFLSSISRQSDQRSSRSEEMEELVAAMTWKSNGPIAEEASYFVFSVYDVLRRRGDTDLVIRWLGAHADEAESIQTLSRVISGEPVSKKAILKKIETSPFGSRSVFLKEALCESHRMDGNLAEARLTAMATSHFHGMRRCAAGPVMSAGGFFWSAVAPSLAAAVLFWLACLGFNVVPWYRNARHRFEEARERGCVPTFWQATALMIAVYLVQVPIGMGMDVFGYAAVDPLVLTVANAFSFGLVLWIGSAWTGASFLDVFPLKRFSVAIVPGMILFLLGVAIICSEVDNLLRSVVPMPKIIHDVMAGITQKGWASLLVLVVCAPLTEEFMFRGLIFRGFRKNYGVSKALVLSSFLFSIFHLNPYQFFGAFVAGLFLGWLLIRTGSLWVPILAHAIFNGLGPLLSVILSVEISGLNSPEPGFHPWWLNALAPILLAVGTLCLKITTGSSVEPPSRWGR